MKSTSNHSQQRLLRGEVLSFTQKNAKNRRFSRLWSLLSFPCMKAAGHLFPTVQSGGYNPQPAQRQGVLAGNVGVEIKAVSAVHKDFSGFHHGSDVAHHSVDGRASFGNTGGVGYMLVIQNIRIDMKINRIHLIRQFFYRFFP